MGDAIHSSFNLENEEFLEVSYFNKSYLLHLVSYVIKVTILVQFIFSSFGLRPVVYLSLMFGGSVETSIEEFWKFL